MSNYCEYPEFSVSFWPKSRKEHKCCECHRNIFKGEVYGRTNMKFDGEMQTFAQHLDCEDACRFVRDVFNADCLYFGELPDYIGDSWLECRRDSEKRYAAFRSLIARWKWRREKNRPLVWLKLRDIRGEFLNHLVEDRKKGRI